MHRSLSTQCWQARQPGSARSARSRCSRCRCRSSGSARGPSSRRRRCTRCIARSARTRRTRRWRSCGPRPRPACGGRPRTRSPSWRRRLAASLARESSCVTLSDTEASPMRLVFLSSSLWPAPRPRDRERGAADGCSGREPSPAPQRQRPGRRPRAPRARPEDPEARAQGLPQDGGRGRRRGRVVDVLPRGATATSAPLAIDQLTAPRPSRNSGREAQGHRRRPRQERHGAELAPGIRRIDPRLVERLETRVDHFRKPGQPAKILLVSRVSPRAPAATTRRAAPSTSASTASTTRRSSPSARRCPIRAAATTRTAPSCTSTCATRARVTSRGSTSASPARRRSTSPRGRCRRRGEEREALAQLTSCRPPAGSAQTAKSDARPPTSTEACRVRGPTRTSRGQDEPRFSRDDRRSPTAATAGAPKDPAHGTPTARRSTTRAHRSRTVATSAPDRSCKRRASGRGARARLSRPRRTLRSRCSS